MNDNQEVLKLIPVDEDEDNGEVEEAGANEIKEGAVFDPVDAHDVTDRTIIAAV